MKHKFVKFAKRAVVFVLFAIFVATTLPLAACKNIQYYYETDEENLNNTSHWENMPFLTESASAKGYVGGSACQHLTSIVRSPLNKDLMFFGTDAAGMCKSVDGGKTWTACNKGLFNSGVSLIAIDPKNDNHVVVYNAASGVDSSKYSAVYYSYDCGENWHKSEGTSWLGVSASQYYYTSLAFDPSSYDATLGYCTKVLYSTPCERDTVFPGAIQDKTGEFYPKRGLYVSNDCGESFSKLDDSEDYSDCIIAVANDCVALGNMNGLFVLEGTEFVQKSDKPVHSLLYTNNRYYVLFEDGVYTSQNLNTFTQIESSNFDQIYLARNLAVSNKNPQNMMLYARKSVTNAYSYRPYYSHDGGASWSLAQLHETDELFYNYTYHAGIVTFDPDDENTVVGIIGGEVIRSCDGGENFYYSGSGVHNLSIGGQFHFNVYDEDLVLLGGYDFGGALTTNGGKTWSDPKLSKDGDGKDIMGAYAATKDTLFGVYVDAWSPGEYFANYRYVCFSHDGGKTVNIDPANIIKASEYRDTTKEDVYANLKVDNTISTGYESSYQSPTDKKILFCANYRSTDNGYTWQNMLETSVGEKCLQVYTHSGKTLYGCSQKSGFVLKSTDGGKSWQKVNSVQLPETNIKSSPSHITDIAIDSVNGYVYAVYFNHLYRMKTDGTEIVDLCENMAKDNFNTYRIRTVAVDPNFPNIVYTGGSGDFYMNSRSVRRSFDSGEHWVTMVNTDLSRENNANADLEPLLITSGPTLGYEARCLRVRSDGTVWCSCLCLGICKLTPPYTRTVKK